MHFKAERHWCALRCTAVLVVAPWVAVAAQAVPAGTAVPGTRTCDGDTITSIDIRTYPPSSEGLAAESRQAASRVLGLAHATTRAAVVTAYLRVAVGQVCTDLDRRESQRLLRAQPFIAAAAVLPVFTSPGHVRLQVDVIDEVRPIVGMGVSRGTLSSVLVGTQNFFGHGLSLAMHAERGFAYRDGYGLRAVKYGIFGRPDFLALEANRDVVDGDRIGVELAEPYLTDLQSRAFHASASLVSGYSVLVRPLGDDVSMFVRRTFYDVGWVTRIRPPFGHRTIALVGAALFGDDVRTGQDLVIIADTGLVTGAASPLPRAYPAFATTRVAAIGGLRNLGFTTVRGFDALTAEQDMGIGVQFDLLLGSSVQAPAQGRDLFVATDVYAGVGNARSFVVARALAEASSVSAAHGFGGLVASSRLAWYGNSSDTRSRRASIDLSAVHGLGFPLQLSFRDADGGLPGFGGATFAGGQRMVARVEQRHLLHTFGSRADFAVSAFATAGKLWAGDVPYGRTTGVHGSAGISLLGSYPAGGKRTYRVDFAVPVNPERGGSRFELRFSATDRTRLLWLEPSDVARARTGAVPASLMKW